VGSEPLAQEAGHVLYMIPDGFVEHAALGRFVLRILVE